MIVWNVGINSMTTVYSIQLYASCLQVRHMLTIWFCKFHLTVSGEFWGGNKDIYQYFISFSHHDMVLVIEIPSYYDDIIKWKHFPHYWPFVWGIHQSPMNSLHKGQWPGALMLSSICTWTNGKQLWCRWFETHSRPLWRHCNDARIFL